MIRLLIACVFAAAVLAVRPAFAAADAFKVTTDKTVDNSSLDSIVKDVVRLSGAKTNDEKAIAILDYLHATIFHFAYPVEKNQSVGPLKVLNVYGWGLCGGQHTVLKALFETAGFQVRYRGWDGHTTIETNYDNHWHYFDVFLKCYFWTKDRKTIAGQDDINADPSIVLDGLKDKRVPADYYLCCGDEAKGIVSGSKGSKPLPPSKPEDGWASVTGRDQGYSPLLRLPSGASLRLGWSGEPNMTAVPGKNLHTCGIKDFRDNKVLGPILEHYGQRTYADGKFIYAPDFSKAADMADINLTGATAADGKLNATAGKGVAIFKLPLPVVYVAGNIDAAFEGDGNLFISTNAGKSWQPAKAGDNSALLKQKYDVYVKAEFAGALKSLRVEATVEHNRCAQPYLLNGKNAITVSANALPKDSVLSVTYAYQEATAPATRKQYNGAGVIYGETKTVTKEITALPFNFEIDVGGNEPPKMLYFERAVKAK
ncbi:MAG TPA: hypothetical protein VKX17_00925 [Planctomycetota bacterium]|nr:hypothetical protein [Planctomycetota bacterium]